MGSERRIDASDEEPFNMRELERGVQPSAAEHARIGSNRSGNKNAAPMRNLLSKSAKGFCVSIYQQMEAIAIVQAGETESQTWKARHLVARPRVSATSSLSYRA